MIYDMTALINFVNGTNDVTNQAVA